MKGLEEREGSIKTIGSCNLEAHRNILLKNIVYDTFTALSGIRLFEIWTTTFTVTYDL